MGEIADMMIEATMNGGHVECDDGSTFIIDPETGEYMGEGAPPRNNWMKRDRMRMDRYENKLREQGFTVERISDYHIRVNGKMEVWHGKKGTSWRIGDGQVRKSNNPCVGVLSIVHRYFKYSPRKNEQ